MTPALSAISRNSTSIPTLLGEPEPFWLGEHPLEQGDCKIQKVRSVLLGKGAVVRAVIAILSDAFRQIKQIAGNAIVCHQPFDAWAEVAAFSSSKSGNNFDRQQRLCGQINRKPKHCTCSVPVAQGSTRRALDEDSRNFWWCVFRWADAGSIFEADVSLNPKKIIQTALKTCGIILGSLKFTAFYRGLTNHKYGRPLTIPAVTENLEPTFPVVLAHLNVGTCVKCHINSAASRAISNKFSHDSIVLLVRLASNLPRATPIVESREA